MVSRQYLSFASHANRREAKRWFSRRTNARSRRARLELAHPSTREYMAMQRILGAVLTLTTMTFLAACGGGDAEDPQSQPQPQPPPPTYSIAATVSNLTGAGLVLQNGSTSVPVASGATTAMIA